MKILAFILALSLMILSFAGCQRKEPSPSDKESEKNEYVTDSSDKNGKDKNDTDESADGDDTTSESETQKNEDTTGPSDKNDGQGEKDPAPDKQDTEKAETTNKNDPDNTDKKEPDNTDKAETDANTGDSYTENSDQYTDGMVLEAYLAVLGSHFTNNYSIGDSLKNTDILHLTALFILTQRSDTVGNAGSDDESFSLSKDQLESTMKILFGEKAKLSEQEKFLDEKKGDKKEGDTYIFSRNRKDWGGKGYYLSYDHDMDIEEKEDSFIAKVTLINDDEKTVSITYTLKKAVRDGYLYAQLTKAKTK